MPAGSLPGGDVLLLQRTQNQGDTLSRYAWPRAREAPSSEPRWITPLGNGEWTQNVAAKDRLIVGDWSLRPDRFLLDAASGAILSRIGGRFPRIDDRGAVLATGRREASTTTCVAPDGRMLWEAHHERVQVLAPTLVVTRSTVGNVILVRERDTGRELRRDSIEASVFAAARDVLFVADKSWLAAYELEGKLLWRHELAEEHGSIKALAPVPRGVYVRTANGSVLRFGDGS
jgi:hypothetical protein